MKKILFLVVMFGFFSSTGCIEDGALPLPDATPPVVEPDAAMSTPRPTVAIQANPGSVAIGERTWITWSSTDATECYTDRERQSETSGSWWSEPITGITEFHIWCFGPGGRGDGYKTVIVTGTVCAEDVWKCGDFGPCSSGGVQSRSCTMSYDCPTAATPPPSTTQSCVVSVPDAGIPDAKVYPDASVPDAKIYPDAAFPRPTLVFAANPATITVRQTSTLSWVTTHASECVLSGGQFGGGVSHVPNGSVVVSPANTTNYWMVCVGPGGTRSSSTTLTVIQPPSDAGVPDAKIYPDASPPDATPPSDATVTPIVCHGLILNFSTTDVGNMDHCTGWTATGSPVALTMATQVVGGAGVCAITCTRKGGAWDTMLPSSVSGVWRAGVTSDVSRWTDPGCRRLPDHPASEPDQAGGTWDGRCEKY